MKIRLLHPISGHPKIKELYSKGIIYLELCNLSDNNNMKNLKRPIKVLYTSTAINLVQSE